MFEEIFGNVLFVSCVTEEWCEYTSFGMTNVSQEGMTLIVVEITNIKSMKKYQALVRLLPMCPR